MVDRNEPKARQIGISIAADNRHPREDLPGMTAGYLNRRGNPQDKAKGIGWQFIRYTVLTIAVPIVGILALNDALTGEAATLIAGAMGYAFGKTPNDE